MGASRGEGTGDDLVWREAHGDFQVQGGGGVQDAMTEVGAGGASAMAMAAEIAVSY